MMKTPEQLKGAIRNLAKKNGIAVVGMRNMSHSGSIGYYTEMAAKEGLAAISFCQSDPMAVPVGGTEPYYGTNPISFAAPTADDRNVVFDMATTVQAWGKIQYRFGVTWSFKSGKAFQKRSVEVGSEDEKRRLSANSGH